MSINISNEIKAGFPEYKMASGKIKLDDSGKMTFSGWANVYGIKDNANDITEFGCCKKTLSEQGNVRQLYYAHKIDMDNKLGHVEVTEKQNGIWIEGELKDNDRGRDIYDDMKRGIIKMMSIGFRVIKATFEEIENEFIRMIKEIKLFEVSVLPPAMACNEASLITDVKSMDDLFAFIIQNKNDENLRNKIFSLYGYKPDDLSTLLKPDEKSTSMVVEPKKIDALKILNAIRKED